MSEQDQIFAKCARRLIPFIAVLYFVNYVDRVNVSFAALTMNRDLGFSPSIYGLGAGIFFWGYLLFQIPANAVLVRVGARRWMFSIMAVWGAISAANAFVRGPETFYALRFLLGVAEAGFFPGMVLYLTYWFPQSYRARFIAGFMIAIPLAFVIGGPLSGAILSLDGVLSLHGWQWLFVIEGLPAFFLAFVVLAFLPDGPATASWLSDEEKNAISTRLAGDSASLDHRFLPALLDPRVLALGLIYFGVNFGRYGVELWLPQIVQGMGVSNLATGFVVALPYALGMAAMIFWGRSSDRRGERIWHVALPALTAAAACAVASFAQNDLLVFVSLAAVVISLLAVQGPFFSLPSSYLSGAAAAGGIALINTLGTGLGGLLGPYVIGRLKESTGGYGSSMAALALGLLLSALIALALGRATLTRPAPLRAPIGD
jgi:ACS family tartrate transporter-like MFS transporter